MCCLKNQWVQNLIQNEEIQNQADDTYNNIVIAIKNESSIS